MQLFVKREWTHKFQEAVIKIQDVQEWTAIHRGIEMCIKSQEEVLCLWENSYNKSERQNEKDNYKKMIDETTDYINLLKNMESVLSIKNEIPMEKYNITKEKVDYKFEFDIRDLSNEEILQKLRDIFPNNDLYLFSNFRNVESNKFKVLGHNGDIVVTYKKHENSEIR